MSGPVSTQDVPPERGSSAPETCEVEISDSREAQVGTFTVRRALPRRARRTVGAWCFVDHMGPAPVTEQHGLDVGPHPHIGLQTVTWLFEGEALHRDSLGSEQLIRPGQLNLMTAGAGVSHSEEATGSYRGTLQGVQLWVAQPEATRNAAPAFEHHEDLPRVEAGPCVATVLVGELAGGASPARRDTDHVGAELSLRRGEAVLPLDPGFEYALVALTGSVSVGPALLAPGHLGYLGTGRQEVALRSDAAAKVLLLGGVPFPEPILMWWNYVARERAEVVEAHRAWLAAEDRFGSFRSPLPRIMVAPPAWSGR